MMKMSLILQVILVLSSLNGIRCILPDSSESTCMENGANADFCDKLMTTTGNESLDMLMYFIYNNSGGALTAAQAPFVLNYFFWLFQPNPLNASNMAASFRLIVINPGGSVQNISMEEVLKNCSLLNVTGNYVFFGVSGYGCNCWGRNPAQTYIGWKLSDWLAFASKYNGTVIWLEYGFRGLSCYGYAQLVLCLLPKIVDFLIDFLLRCIPTAFFPNLILIGFSLGAQIVGYIGKYLNQKYGKLISIIYAIDPAGLGFGRGPLTLCQGLLNAAKYIISIRLNPGIMVTPDMCISNSTVLVDAQAFYRPPECASSIDPTCSHLLGPRKFWELTLGGVPIQTTYTQEYPFVPGMGEFVNISITPGVDLMSGFYNWNSYKNMSLLG